MNLSLKYYVTEAGVRDLFMLVKCIAKWGKDLPPDGLRPKDGFGADHKFRLIIDKNYIVYGMTVYAGYIWYYICEKGWRDYPTWNPCPLFEVIDGRLSKYWVFSCEKYGPRVLTRICYPEWANDPYYYDRLTDSLEEDVQIFMKYKHLMDLEFPDPLAKAAEALEDPWLFCPLCIDAWESHSQDGMVICPSCNRPLLNPKFKIT